MIRHIFNSHTFLKITSLQEEFFFNLNESDTEDEEDNELLSQEYSLSRENSSLISDNSGICNSSIIGNGIDAGNNKNVMKMRKDPGMNFDIGIFRCNIIEL